MRVLAMLGAASALDCAKFGLESFDKVNVVSGLFSTPPLLTNKTIYFNPCRPLEGMPECGPNNNFCEIDQAEFGGQWVRTAVRWSASPEQGSQEAVVQVDDALFVNYFGAQWGDFKASAAVAFECGPELRVLMGRDEDPACVAGVTVKTPLMCGFIAERPGAPAHRAPARVHLGVLWQVLLWLTLAPLGLLVAWVVFAVVAASRQRALGPLRDEVLAALTDLPLLVREMAARISDFVLGAYELATGRGTGRNAI